MGQVENKRGKRGLLFLVVGASGVGKDSLLIAAMSHFQACSRISFPQRYITRPTSAGHENHCALSEEIFKEWQKSGKFLFSWQAHGLSYGIPIHVMADLQNGQHQVINVSRSVLGQAEALLSGAVRILHIQATADILRQRLLARGRETEDQIEKRLQRLSNYQIMGRECRLIQNNTDLASARHHFIQAIEEQILES